MTGLYCTHVVLLQLRGLMSQLRLAIDEAHLKLSLFSLGEQSVCPWSSVTNLQFANPLATLKHRAGEREHSSKSNCPAYEQARGGT